jgi:hypothetical protein
VGTTGRKERLISIAAFVMVLFGEFSYVCAGTTPLEWYVTGPNAIQNETAALMPAGNAVQFIYIGQDGTINAPIMGAAGGDDVLVYTTAIGYGIAPLPLQPGHFYVAGAAIDDIWDNRVFYTRAWNAAVPTSGTYYGDSSAGHTFVAGVGDSYNAGAGGSWSTLVRVPNGTISGTVTLQGRADFTSTVTFELRIPGSTVPMPQYQPVEDTNPLTPGTQILLPSNGAYTLRSIAPGAYNLTCNLSRYLRQKIANVVVTDGANTPDVNFSLRGGDANESNSVNVLDLNILKTTYGKSMGQSGYDARADFDDTNSVNVLDLNILKSNYGKSGDP